VVLTKSMYAQPASYGGAGDIVCNYSISGAKSCHLVSYNQSERGPDLLRHDADASSEYYSDYYATAVDLSTGLFASVVNPCFE